MVLPHRNKFFAFGLGIGLLVFSAAAFILTVVIPTWKKSNLDQMFTEAKKMFEEQKYDEAFKKIEPRYQDLLDLPDGCELVISILALKDLHPKALEDVSQKCYQNNHPIGYEGFAKSLTDQNDIGRAFEVLKKEEEVKPSESTLHGVLGELAYLLEKDEEAKVHFIKALEFTSHDSSAYFDRWFRSVMIKPRVLDKAAAQKIFEIVKSKPIGPSRLEEIFLLLIKTHFPDMLFEIDELTKRLESQKTDSKQSGEQPTHEQQQPTAP